jgi:hypothetical protein
MIQIPLGESRGWIELHIDGRALLYSVDYPDEPIFQFNAEDAEILTALSGELGTMGEAWEELKKQSPEYANPARETGNKYDHAGEDEHQQDDSQSPQSKRAKGSASPDQPQLVGMTAPKVAVAGSS